MAEQTPEMTTTQKRDEDLGRAHRMIAAGHGLVKVGGALKRFAERHGGDPLADSATAELLLRHFLNLARDRREILQILETVVAKLKAEEATREAQSPALQPAEGVEGSDA